LCRGGATIGDVIRRAWSRLIRKQWLFLYPVSLAVIDTLAFLAVYAAADGSLSWSAFFGANFERAAYIHDQFLTSFQFSALFGVAVFAGVAVCLFEALISAPLFHAIAGPGYPLAPKRWGEAANLFVFYLLLNVVVGVVPLLAPAGGVWEIVVGALAWAIVIMVVFADYVIVYESVPLVPAVRRSLQLLRSGWPPVLAVFIVLNLVAQGLQLLYHHFYDGQDTVFVVLPIAQILLDSIVWLFGTLVLIFLYEDLRRRSPAG
jgi:hypothetical protein